MAIRVALMMRWTTPSARRLFRSRPQGRLRLNEGDGATGEEKAMRWWVKAAVVAAMVLAAGVARAADDIRIGAFLSVTGVMSPMGDPEHKALTMLVERLNAEGGINGRPVKLVSYDDGSDPEKAAMLVKRLIDNDGADIILGGSGTPTSMAVLTTVERAEIPYVSMGGGIAIVEPVRKWVFKVPQTDRMAAIKVFADMRRRGLTRIALLSENVGFGKSGHDQSLALAPAHGIEVVADEVYSPKDPDVTPQLTRIRAAKGVQALFIFGTGTGPAVATRNLRQLGLTLPVYQSHGVASREFLRLAGGAADGMRLPVSALAVVDRLADADPQKPVAAAFKKAFEERWRSDVDMVSGHAYDALFIAVDAIRRAGTTDKAKVRDAIEQTRGFVGTAGVVNMSPTDHLGLAPDAFHLVEIRGGDWVLVQ
jgi:branched-chain amino acid transport system substrate-binding protein